MSEKLKSVLGKPLFVGAAAAGAAYYLRMMSTTTVLGTSVPAWAIMGAVGVGSTFAAQTLNQFIIPYLPTSNKTLVKLEGALLNPVIAGAATIAGMKLLDDYDLSSMGVPKTLLIGAGSYFVGDYVYNHFIGNSV